MDPPLDRQTSQSKIQSGIPSLLILTVPSWSEATFRGDEDSEGGYNSQREKFVQDRPVIQYGQASDASQINQALFYNELGNISPPASPSPTPMKPFVKERYVEDYNSNPRELFWVNGSELGNTNKAEEGQLMTIPKRSHNSNKTRRDKTGTRSKRNKNKGSDRANERESQMVENMKEQSSTIRNERERNASGKGTT